MWNGYIVLSLKLPIVHINNIEFNNFNRLDSCQEVQCDSCQKHFNCDAGDAMTVCQNGITISFCSNRCMMGVCAFCKDPKLKSVMFEIHNVGDCIEMACSLKCLTLLGETKSEENGAASANVSPVVVRENLFPVHDPPLENVPRFFPLFELMSTMQPVLIICVEILHHILVHKNIASDSNVAQTSELEAASVERETLQANDDADTASDSPEVAGSRGKRLYEDVDQEDIELDDELAKRVKENENAEESNGMLLNVVVHDAAPVEASLNEEEDLLELSPSQLLQLFIDSEVVAISWNTDSVFTNESNDIDGLFDQLDAKSEVDCSSNISAPENRS